MAQELSVYDDSTLPFFFLFIIQKVHKLIPWRDSAFYLQGLCKQIDPDVLL